MQRCAAITHTESLKLANGTTVARIYSLPARLGTTVCESLAQTLAPLLGHAVEQPPDHILKLMGHQTQITADHDLKLTDALQQYLYEYQLAGAEFIVNHHGRGIIADQMGLGKTLQAVAVLQHYQTYPALIVCPAAVLMSWTEHLGTWLDAPVCRIRKWKDKAALEGLTVVSFGMVNSTKWRPELNALLEQGLQALVVDESHYVKNGEAQRTQMVTQLAHRAQKACVLLSGTPMSCPAHLFSQLACVNPSFYPHFFPKRRGLYCAPTQKDTNFYFGARYCQPVQKYIRAGRKRWMFKGSEREDELHAVIKHVGVICRTKDDHLSNLPSKSRERIVVHEWRQPASPADKVPDWRRGSQFMERVRETGLRKQNNVMRYLKEVVVEEMKEDPTLKMLVFARHHVMMDACFELLQNTCGLNTVMLNGKTSQPARDSAIRRFQESDTRTEDERKQGVPRVAVLSSALACGLTLTKAKLAVMVELGFSPGVMLQAEDRIHRIGQTLPVEIRYLVCKGSTDERVWSMLGQKIKQATRTLEGQEKPWKYTKTVCQQLMDTEEEEQQQQEAESAQGEESVRLHSHSTPTTDDRVPLADA